jgi:hypothetical protein
VRVEKKVTTDVPACADRKGIPDGADRIPYPNELDVGQNAVPSNPPFLKLRIGGRPIRPQLPDRPVDSTTVPCIKLFDGQGRSGLEYTALGDQAREAPCCIGASTKPEQEDVVTWLEDLYEPGIGVDDLVIEAVALDATADLLPEARRNAMS